MPRRTNQFQRLITLINASLAGHAKVVESAMLTDKATGEQREVDVLITTSASGYEVNIAIEVVAHKRKAGTPWVESMHSKHSSLETDKVILVSESGFSAPALKKARFYGFEAVTIDAALTADWKVAAELTATGFFELTTFNYTCTLVYESEVGTRQQIKVPSNAVVSSDTTKYTLDGLVRYALALPEAKNALYPRIRAMNEREFWFRYYKPGGLWDSEINGEKVRIMELRVDLNVDHTNTPVTYSSGKYRSTPFIAGTASSNPNQLQFALVRKPDGTTEGRLVDASGVRNMTGGNDYPDET